MHLQRTNQRVPRRKQDVLGWYVCKVLEFTVQKGVGTRHECPTRRRDLGREKEIAARVRGRSELIPGEKGEREPNRSGGFDPSTLGGDTGSPRVYLTVFTVSFIDCGPFDVIIG